MRNEIKAEELDLQPWDDQLFERRNKAYGAYAIRKAYVKHVAMGLLFTVIVLLLVILYPRISQFFDHQDIAVNKTEVVTYRGLGPPPPIEKDRSVALGTPPTVKAMVKYVVPQVTKNTATEDVPTTEEIKKNLTGSETVISSGDASAGEVLGEGGDYAAYLDELDPEFPGGENALMQYISKNIRYPVSAQRMRLQGVVVVSFLVNKEGGIEEVKTLKSLSPDCDREAERVISLMPRWIPGRQSGKPAQKRFALPVKFNLNNPMAVKKPGYSM
jgi:protein TonB